MPDEVVILFPDLGGEGSRGDFGKQLVDAYPDAHLIPLLNGSEPAQLRQYSASLDATFEPVVSEATTLAQVLAEGYAYVVKHYPVAAVVRIDTDEHEIAAIPLLLQQAQASGGMVIGDLEFGGATLRAGSLDEFVNLNLYPELTRHFTSGQLVLSGAYGFQAFAPNVLSTIMAKAQAIVAEAERELTHTLHWGFDAAVFLGALASGLQVRRVAVTADVIRDRAREKIARQLEDSLAVYCAANRLYKLAAASPH